MISFQAHENSKVPNFKKREIANWIKSVISSYNMKVGDITYMFGDDEYILEVNRQFLDHDYYTDIITFDSCEDNIVNGDIVISLDTVKSNSEKFNVSFNEELFRVIIHGILHLCGEDDHEETDIANMRAAEEKALAALNSK